MVRAGSPRLISLTHRRGQGTRATCPWTAD